MLLYELLLGFPEHQDMTNYLSSSSLKSNSAIGPLFLNRKKDLNSDRRAARGDFILRRSTSTLIDVFHNVSLGSHSVSRSCAAV